MVECKSIRKVFALKPIFMYGNVTGTYNSLNGPVPYPIRSSYVPYCIAICMGRGTHGRMSKEGVYGTKTTLVSIHVDIQGQNSWKSHIEWVCEIGLAAIYRKVLIYHRLFLCGTHHSDLIGYYGSAISSLRPLHHSISTACNHTTLKRPNLSLELKKHYFHTSHALWHHRKWGILHHGCWWKSTDKSTQTMSWYSHINLWWEHVPSFIIIQ